LDEEQPEPEYTDSNHQAQDEELLSADISLKELEVREEKVYQMVDDLTELQGMFNDLSQLVHDQQEDVDRLEVNIEETADQVQSGTQNLIKASEHQKSYRKKICWILMILLVVLVLVVALTFGLQKKK